ncbi:hypothetical protein BH20ACT17_BH20ACT17_11480 [soil metagenome]
MSFGPADEAPHTPAQPAPGFLDALTFSFGDLDAQLYGVARLALDGDGRASAMAIIYSGHEPVAGGRQAGVALEEDVAGWESVRAAGVSNTVRQPLEAWTVSYDGDAGAGFELRFEATSVPAVIEADASAGQAGAIQGYEQTCSVNGSVSHGGRTHQLRCLGQRGHLWGAPEPGGIELVRTLSAWLGADRALTLTAVQPAGAKLRHLDEAITGWVIERGEPVAIAEPRLSTTYDGELRQRRAGLELWMDEEGTVGRRAWGEVLCGTTIGLGDMRLDSAFFHWRMEGREGVGLYDVLRSTNGERAGR